MTGSNSMRRRMAMVALLCTSAAACGGPARQPAELHHGLPVRSVGPDGAVGSDVATAPDFGFGMAVPRSNYATLESVEQQLGARMEAMRVFARWDTQFPSADVARMLEEGRTVHLSVRPRTEAKANIMWSDIAAAQPGTRVYEQLKSWLERVIAYDGQVYFTLNHEPETKASAPNGTAPEYVAAWRRMVDLLRELGGHNVKTVLVTGRGPYVTGEIDDWYPGDDYVDIVGVDPYNWYQCQGTDRGWESPHTLIEPALRFAVERDKKLAVAELASTEDPDDPTRKAQWIDELGDYLSSSSVHPHLEHVTWFSVHDSGWPDCQWEWDSSPQSAEAFARLAQRLNR